MMKYLPKTCVIFIYIFSIKAYCNVDIDKVFQTHDTGKIFLYESPPDLGLFGYKYKFKGKREKKHALHVLSIGFSVPISNNLCIWGFFSDIQYSHKMESIEEIIIDEMWIGVQYHF